MLRKVYFLFCLLLLAGFDTIAQTTNVDVLIKNAYVFLGDGKDSVLTNIGIAGERISYIGKEEIKAKQLIDAKGKFVAPGFIDTHTHADRWIEDRKRQQMLSWIYQGVTTVFAGNDGFGSYKIADKMAEYEEIGMGTNFALYVGFGSIRRDIVGLYKVAPTPEKLEKMKLLVASGMQEGAIGFSTGLSYLPQMYSKTNEVAQLYSEAAKYGGVYDTHMRSESNSIMQSIDETIAIGEKTNMPLHISHLKVSGEKNWGTADEVIAKINKARARGVNLTANQYPFEASMTGFKSTVIPDWAQEGGDKRMLERFKDENDLEKIKEYLRRRKDDGYKRIVIMSKNREFKDITGKSVSQIAQEWNKTNEDATIDILKMNPSVSAISFSMSEEDIVKFMSQQWVMTGSDGGNLHPRTYSTFTRILEEYVQKRKLMSLSWAIHRATGLTATTFNLKDRGFIKEGYYADIIIFNPENIKANSTFKDPEQYSQGMDYVFVNGIKAIDNGKKTGKLAGKIIKKQ